MDHAALDRVERRFWRDIWESVPAAVADEHGVELRQFGPIQASIVKDLPRVGMLNLLLGAAEATAADHLATASEWAKAAGVAPYVPVTPGLRGSEQAERWLRENGFVE